LGAIEEEEVRKPRIVLNDIWSACKNWSTVGIEVPLSLENFDSDVKQYYNPSLSAIQIFTIKPFSDDSRFNFLFSLTTILCLIASWVTIFDVKVCAFITKA
jgi:hypothetical protein